MFLKISLNSQENACARITFFVKLQADTFNFTLKTFLAQLFFYEFRETLKNTLFILNTSRGYL